MPYTPFHALAPPQALPRGFTLLELLVVLVVLGLLVSIVGPRYWPARKVEAKAAQAQMASIVKSLDMYRIDVGRYPTTEQGLGALNAAPTSEPVARPYLQKQCPRTPGPPMSTSRPANRAASSTS
jgi:general secretion pathway protein G